MTQPQESFDLPRPTLSPGRNGRDCSWLEIFPDRLEHNIAAMRRLLLAPTKDGSPRPHQPKLCGVVKKDAYGLGAVPIAHRLVKAGCDMLAVFSPQEAEHLVKNALTCPILIFMPLNELSRTDLLYRHAVAGRLHLSIHDPKQLSQVNNIGRTFGIKMPVHLFLDTGMSRGGLNIEQFGQVMASIGDNKHMGLVGIYSHLATADNDPDYAYKQLERFEQVVADAAAHLGGDITLHLANSFATLRDRKFHLDMVRCGLALWGYGPELLTPGPVIPQVEQLQPIVRWVSSIIHVQRYPRRSPVGYGATHKLRRQSTLGVVPVGYADGYPLALSNKATVRVYPHDPAEPIIDAKVVGKVNMDQIVIDLTDAPHSDSPDGQRALLNTAVEVISADPGAPNSLPQLAKLAQSHCYEMLCRLSTNLPRHYVQ